jgi:hypothetical protein
MGKANRAMGMPRFRIRSLLIAVAVLAVLCAGLAAFFKLGDAGRIIVAMFIPVVLVIPTVIFGFAAALREE